MTKSLAISAAITLFTYVLPNEIVAFVPNIPFTLLGVISCTKNVNSIFNFIIMYTRHPEIRVGLAAALTGRQMGPNLSQWTGAHRVEKVQLVQVKAKA